MHGGNRDRSTRNQFLRVNRVLYECIVLLETMFLLIGCGTAQPVNPSFDLSMDDAREALTAMHKDRVTLSRPVIVAGGIADPGIMASSVARQLEQLVTDSSIVKPVSFFGAGTFDACRKRLLETVAELPVEIDETHRDPTAIEVDVVAISMGGLAARYAALPNDQDDRRLRIVRLFTIASPHRGAQLAELPSFDSRVKDMREGSTFLHELDEHLLEAEYELVSYVRLDDVIVGADRAAPPGEPVWWLPNRFGEFAHLGAAADPRIIADIARRLRGEKPFTTPPPEPLPTTDPGTAPAELQTGSRSDVAAKSTGERPE